MKYFRLIDSYGNLSIAVETGENLLEDITSVEDDIDDISALIKASAISGVPIDNLSREILESGEADTIDLNELLESSRSGSGDLGLDRPFDPPEVWAAGVNYKNSEM